MIIISVYVTGRIHDPGFKGAICSMARIPTVTRNFLIFPAAPRKMPDISGIL